MDESSHGHSISSNILSMQCAISIFGKDSPGIIAEITSVLIAHQVNIEDASMTILQGHFAMILVVSLEEMDLSFIEDDLKKSNKLIGFDISVSASDSDGSSIGKDETTTSRYMLQLSVRDTPGIVARITKTLGNYGANIVDCSTRRDNATEVFTMFLDVDVPIQNEVEIVSEIKSVSSGFVGDVLFRKVESIDL